MFTDFSFVVGRHEAKGVSFVFNFDFWSLHQYFINEEVELE